MTRRIFLFFFCCFFVSSLSCTYIDRFYIRIQEDESYPCFGVQQFDILLESVDGTQEKIVQKKQNTYHEDSQQYWNLQTGKCNLPFGLPIKDVGYGGMRKLIVKGFDSTGKTLLVEGVSNEFLLERSGADVSDEILLSFSRKKEAKRETLQLRFSEALPAGVQLIEVIIQGESTREFLVTDVLPTFLTISNVTPTDSGQLQVVLWSDVSKQKKLKESKSNQYALKEWLDKSPPPTDSYRKLFIYF